MSWEYLQPQSDRNGGKPAPANPQEAYVADPGWDLTGNQQETHRTSGVDAYEQLVQEFTRNENRRKQIETSLGELYKLPKFKAYSPAATSRLRESLGLYEDLLTKPDDASASVKAQRIDRPEFAAAHLAAVSLLKGLPLSGIVGRVVRYYGLPWTQLREKNMQTAKDYILANRVMVVWPRGLHELSDATLAKGIRECRVNPFTAEELRLRGLGKTGLRQMPAPFTVLMADIIHNQHNPLLPAAQSASQRSVSWARNILDQADRTDDYAYRHGTTVIRQKAEQNKIDDANKIIEAEDARRVTVTERKDVKRAVLDAAARQLGFDLNDESKIVLS